ncbi:hypothetical protein QOZ80_9BG0699590 [Eleusine coracana subsp. coracana]|nr:hypothetical protein QOZ80_9BG0699590 [Eleusine coracana subsp. coracana]
MVSKGSPKFRGSPKLRRFVAAASATRKKPSPKSCGAKKTLGSPRALQNQRASWNPALEKSLVDILLEYKDTGFRGDNGCWNSKGWNRMVQEFHHRNRYVSFTKAKIQDKGGQLKRDYKMLKEARKQSGSHWNEKSKLVEGSPSMWDKLVVFRNNKATFPLFDDLGELYDGHLAEGNHNFVSLESPRTEDLFQPIHDLEYEDNGQGFNDIMAHDVEDEVTEVHRLEENESEAGSERNGQQRQDEEKEPTTNERRGQRRGVAAALSKEEREEKRPRKGANVEGMMERYLQMRTKQAEDEAAQLAKEKEVAQGNQLEEVLLFTGDLSADPTI